MIAPDSPMPDLFAMTADELRDVIHNLELVQSNLNSTIDDRDDRIDELENKLEELQELDDIRQRELEQLQEYKILYPMLLTELEAYLDHLQTSYQTDRIKEVVERTAMYSLKEIVRSLKHA